MTDVPAEVVARGRAIFDRLRGAVPTDSLDDPADPSADERPAVDPSDPINAADQPEDPTVAEPDAVTVEAVSAGEPSPAPTTPDTGGVEAAPPADAPMADAPMAEAPPGAPEAEGVTADPAVRDSVGDETRLGSEVPTIEALVTAPPAPADPDVDPPAAEPVIAAEPAAATAPPPDPRTPDARRVPELVDGDVGPDASRFARPLPRIIAVANQKGGVGKTTTTVNLAACLADLGYRVLIVDLDPQGNASTGVGINIRDLANSMYDVLLRDAPMEDCIEATSVRNLYVAPANLELAGAEIELVPAFSRELKLRAAIDSIRADYDFVFVDCPPSLGLLTVNSLAAASEVLVPIQCEYYALEGLGQLLRNVALVQKNLNPTLEVSVIVCVMYDARTKLADQVVAEVRAHFGDKVCRTVVPRTVRLSEAPSYGQPISAFDPSSRGAIAYKELAKEVGGGTPQRVG